MSTRLKPFIPFKVFLVFLSLYLLTWGGHYTSGDGAQKLAWTKAVLSGDYSGSQSRYGIGHSLIAMAPIALSSGIHKLTGIRCEAALYTLLFVVNGTLFVALVACYLLQFYTPRRMWTTVSVIGLGTIWWPYTKMDFSEPLITTLFFAGFLIMRFGRSTLGMLVAASVIVVRTDACLLIGLLGVWEIWKQRTARTCAELLCAIMPSLLVVGASNWIRYHSLFDRGYSGEAFSTPLFQGLYGLLLSPGKSVFLFSPPLLLGLLGWKRFRQRSDTRSDALLFLAIFAVQLLEYARWWDWSSDDAWGVRFIIPSVVLMCIPAAEVLERRLLVAAVAGIGVSVQLLAVMVGGLDYLLLVRARQPERQAVFVSGRNHLDFEDLRFNPRYGQIAGSWMLLRHLLHIPPHATAPELIEKTGTPLYDTLPPSVWARAARWDFIWARRRGVLRDASTEVNQRLRNE